MIIIGLIFKKYFRKDRIWGQIFDLKDVLKVFLLKSYKKKRCFKDSNLQQNKIGKNPIKALLNITYSPYLKTKWLILKQEFEDSFLLGCGRSQKEIFR